MINKSNYEAWLMDYLDGKLSAEMMAELLLFLDSNPEIKAEFINLKEVGNIPPLSSSFSGKEWLKFEEDEEALFLTADEMKCLSALEGDMSENEKYAFVSSLADSKALSDTWLSLNRVKLQPDDGIAFSHRKALKRAEVLPYQGINEDNYEEVFAAFHEDNPDDDRRKEMAAFLALNTVLQPEFELFARIKFEADTRVVFSEKSSLYVKPAGIRYLLNPYISGSIAAGLALLFAVGTLLKTEPNQERLFAARSQNTGIRTLTAEVSKQAVQESIHVSRTVERTVSRRDILNMQQIEPIALAAVELTKTAGVASTDARTYYTGLYYDLQISNELLAGVSQNSAEPSAATPLASIAEYGRQRVLSAFSSDAEPKSLAFSWWSLAEAGVAGINRLTNNDFEIHRSKDENSNRTFAISGGPFELSNKRSKP